MTIRFFVHGDPATAGSKVPFISKTTGKLCVKDMCKRNAPWRKDVVAAAKAAYRGPLLQGPITISVIFYLQRPKAHYRTGRFSHMLKKDAPEYPITKPDGLKLMRAAEDALTGVIWFDDAQVVHHVIYKRYGKPGADIEIIQGEPGEEYEG